jgi:tripartite-type tricarboxylate transporter receptor subunit TctC
MCKPHRIQGLLASVRRYAVLAPLVAALCPLAGHAQAAYPERPVTIVSAFPSGGIVDLIARRLAQRFSERFKQSFVVENKTGAAGSIGYAAVARAPADGYTLVVASGPTTMLPNTEASPSWNPATAFSAIGMIGTIPQAIVTSNAMPARTLPDFLEQARTRPGQINYGSPGIGTTPFFTMELLKAQHKLKLTHIAYRGQPEVMTDLIRGDLGITSVTAPLVLAHVQAGRMQALAVTSRSRLQALPNVPTVHELGMPGLAISNWFALLAPANVPNHIVLALAKELNDALGSPEMQASFSEIGLLIDKGVPPADTLAFVRADLARWTALSGTLNNESPTGAGVSK